MAIIVKNNPPAKPQQLGPIRAGNIQVKNENKKPEGDIHIKTNPSSVSAKKKDGTIIKKYPYNLFIDDEKIEIDNNLHEMINKIIKEI